MIYTFDATLALWTTLDSLFVELSVGKAFIGVLRALMSEIALFAEASSIVGTMHNDKVN